MTNNTDSADNLSNNIIFREVSGENHFIAIHYTCKEYLDLPDRVEEQISQSDIPDFLRGYRKSIFSGYICNGVFFIVLYCNGRASGFMKYDLESCDDAREYYEIDEFGIDVSHRGKGFGRKMIEHAIDLGKKYQRNVRLNSVDDAIPFYKKCGFVDVVIDGESNRLIYICDRADNIAVKCMNVSETFDEFTRLYVNFPPSELSNDITSAYYHLTEEERSRIRYFFIYRGDLIIGFAEVSEDLPDDPADFDKIFIKKAKIHADIADPQEYLRILTDNIAKHYAEKRICLTVSRDEEQMYISAGFLAQRQIGNEIRMIRK